MSDYPLLIAIVQMVTAIATLGGIAFNTVRLNRTAANVQKIELATNSMKDALVAATAEASEFKGAERGRIEQTAERAAEKSTEATVGAAVEKAVEKVADKSLDKVAGAVADAVVEKVEKAMEQKP